MNNQKIPKIKKEIETFLIKDDGSINKKNAAMIAMSVIAVAALVSGVIDVDIAKAACGHGQYVHSDY